MKIFRMITILLVLAALPLTALAQDVPRMDKDELKAQLESVTVVDVRSGSDWRGSEFKIKGAVRPKGDIAEFAATQNWAKDTKLVLYCA